MIAHHLPTSVFELARHFRPREALLDEATASCAERAFCAPDLEEARRSSRAKSTGRLLPRNACRARAEDLPPRPSSTPRPLPSPELRRSSAGFRRRSEVVRRRLPPLECRGARLRRFPSPRRGPSSSADRRRALGFRPTTASDVSGISRRTAGRMACTKYRTASSFGNQSIEPVKTRLAGFSGTGVRCEVVGVDSGRDRANVRSPEPSPRVARDRFRRPRPSGSRERTPSLVTTHLSPSPTRAAAAARPGCLRSVASR